MDPAHRGEENPPNVDVRPVVLSAQGASSPNPDSAAGKRANAIHTLGIEIVLVLTGQMVLKIQHTFEDFVGRRFVHPSGVICAGIHSRYVPTGRDQFRRPRIGELPNLQPGVIDGAILSIDVAPLLPNIVSAGTLV